MIPSSYSMFNPWFCYIFPNRSQFLSPFPFRFRWKVIGAPQIQIYCIWLSLWWPFICLLNFGRAFERELSRLTQNTELNWNIQLIKPRKPLCSNIGNLSIALKSNFASKCVSYIPKHIYKNSNFVIPFKNLTNKNSLSG